MGQEEDNKKQGKWKQIDEKERYHLEILLREGLAPPEAAKRLGRDRRTIEREIKRGSVIQRDKEWRDRQVYCADVGQRVKKEREANKGQALKIGHDHELVRYIERKIGQEKYSPDAVIGEILAKGIPFQEKICTKTLYNYIDRGLFLNISNKDLPIKRSGKKRAYHRVRKVALNNLRGRSIEDRPKSIDSREENGHWEMDCVVGCGKACLLVLTERKTREEMVFKMAAKTQQEVISIMDRLERRHKSKFPSRFKSITMDNGSEFLDMEKLERSCLSPGGKRTTCYYAHPYSAWERGSNETANKLIRRFVPKGTNINNLSKSDVKRIERWMNNYPRRMFGYKSANDMKVA